MTKDSLHLHNVVLKPPLQICYWMNQKCLSGSDPPCQYKVTQGGQTVGHAFPSLYVALCVEYSESFSSNTEIELKLLARKLSILYLKWR